MKTLLFKLLLSFMTMTLVQSSAFAARPLDEVMDEMGSNFKALGKSLGRGIITSNELNKSRELVALAEESLTLLPDLSSFPDQTIAAERYRSLIADLIVALKDLEAALTRSNVSEAMVLLKKIDDMRKAGHDEYKL